MKDDFSEKRKHKRKELVVLVNFSIKGSAYSKNISEDGICLDTKEDFVIGETVELIFFLQDEKNVFLSGIVRWKINISADSYEYGIEFNERDEYSEKIKSFLDD
jgi:Tfp pilus assembly protein PilZ